MTDESAQIHRLRKRRKELPARVGLWRIWRGTVAIRAAIRIRSSTCCTNIRAAGVAKTVEVVVAAAPLAEEPDPLRVALVRAALPAWRPHRPTKACHLPAVPINKEAEAVRPSSELATTTAKNTNTIDSTRRTLMPTTGWILMCTAYFFFHPSFQLHEWFISIWESLILIDLNYLRFQYVLAAATSIATKVNEESLTYLNQGQPYEIKMKKLGDLSNFRGKLLRVSRLLMFRFKITHSNWLANVFILRRLERRSVVFPRTKIAVHGTRTDCCVENVAAGWPHRRDRRALVLRHLRSRPGQ